MSKSQPLAIPLLLLWLVGNALRLGIIAVPPVIPALRAELHLSGTDVGTLTGLPIVLFGAAALVGSRLVARVGVVPAAVTGLLLAALGSGLRGISPDVVTVFAATAVMGIGVAIAQPAVPTLIGQWLPRHIGLGTGTYSNGLLVGGFLPVTLFPVLLSAFGQSWRATFVFWAVLIGAVAVLLLVMAPRDAGRRVVSAPKWWPDMPFRDIIRLGLIFGGASALYYGTNAFLPEYLTQAGRPDLVNSALIALNTGQLPASLLLIGFGRHLERKAWPFALAGIISSACIGLIVVTANFMTIVGAAVFGFFSGAVFALGLTLPPLLSRTGEVARVSAAMFTISYATAMIIAVVGGVAWDLTGIERFAFLPIALSSVPLIVLTPTIRFDRGQSRLS